jgi:hypothetical protein
MKPAVDSGEGGGQSLTLLLVAVPKQIEVSGQFSGAVHDAGDLSDHHGVDTGLVQGSEKWKRIEAEGVISVDGAGCVVGVVVSPPGSLPAAGDLPGESHCVAQAVQGVIVHPSIQSFRVVVRIWDSPHQVMGEIIEAELEPSERR